MTPRTKVAVDEGVSGQEALGLPWRFEPLHLPFSARVGQWEFSARLFK
jgi:hypothetical protein